MIWQRTAVFLAALVILPTTALAQQGPRDRAARSLITDAVEEYQNLEIDRSLERLQNAVRTCANSGCSPAMTARVHMAIGIVQVGGQQNTTAGVESMVRALQLDSNAQPDAMLVTPEISAAFRQAQGQVSSGARPTTNPNPTTNPTRPSSSGGGELLHTPAPEQLANTPLPVYVEPSAAFTVEHVYVYYKGNGMRSFERREMSRSANGYGAEIPCAAMIAPSMEYYVTAVDANTQVVATVGSETSPVQVSIVTRRSHPAPALPGRSPPETCAADTEECPPGMTGPQCRSRPAARGNRGLGDPCAANDECGEGLHCDAGACGVGEPSATDPTEPTDPSAVRTSRFSLDFGGGIGAAFLTGRPSYAEQRLLVNSSGQVIRRDCGDVVCYQTIDPGFAPTFFLSANVRYNITPRVGAAVVARFQFDAAPWTIPATTGGAARSNPFANLLLMARMYYAFTPHGFASSGFVASAFAGGGVGQIEPKPALPSTETRDGAHVLSGYGNAHAGVRVEYNVRNGFHAGAEVALQFMFPTFLFNIDTTVFLGFHL
jgi:hypothetical protein